MTVEPGTESILLDSTVNDARRALCAKAANGLLKEWESTGQADLAKALLKEPILIENHSVFLNLVQSEYRFRKAAFPSDNLERFCKRFEAILPPGLYHSARRLIEVEQYLSECPSILKFLGNIEWPVEGDKFDEFVLISEIGRGASSRVFLARQPSLGNRTIVLKVMPIALDEANIVAKLDHENVIVIHATGKDETSGLHWICMPFRGKRTIHQAINEGLNERLSREATKKQYNRDYFADEEYVISLAAEIAKGISYIHSKGIFHGDLKPSNILLTDQNVPLLIDFNLAQTTDVESRNVGGTLPYMAPEQLSLLGSSDFIDCSNTVQSEAYSFGVLVYEMLIGEHPYCGKIQSGNYQESVKSILEAKATSIDEYHSKLIHHDPGLRRLLVSCLSDNADERPASFDEIIDALEKMSSRFSRITRYARKRPATISATLALLASIVIAGMFFYPTVVEYLTIKRADWNIADGEHAKAIQILAPFVEDNPSNLRAKRRLSNAYLSEGNFEYAKDSFYQSWRLSNDPLDVAMVGYCLNLQIGSDTSEGYYRKANQVKRFFNVAVNHNYSKKLLNSMITQGANSQISELVEELLMSAHQNSQENKSIQMLMMRHTIFNYRNGLKIPSSYKHKAILVEINYASSKTCSLTLEYLACISLDKHEKTELGFKYLKNLVAYRGYDEVIKSTRPGLLEPYSHLDEFNQLKATPRKKSPRVLDPLLNPLDYCSAEDKHRYFSGLLWVR